MYKVGSLFAGIGGLELGLEATGKFKTVWQVERDSYATKVLKKHWPDVPKHDDVCTFPPEAGNWDCDLICGGFPCQDISFAGKGAGLAGQRSGLFYEGIRIIDRLRPRWVLLENVTALLIRGLDDVLRELAEIGYDAQWHCVPAAAVGAHHRRDRIFIIGNMANANGANGPTSKIGMDKNRPQKSKKREGGDNWTQFGRCSTIMAKAKRNLCRVRSERGGAQWGVEPQICRMANGVPDRIHRIRCLGNAVVPQVAQFMGEIILDRMGENEWIH